MTGGQVLEHRVPALEHGQLVAFSFGASGGEAYACALCGP
jgi:hypothetical protein